MAAALVLAGLSALTLCQQAPPPDYTILKINELSRGYRISEDETKYFNLTIKGGMGYDVDDDLIVKVFSEGYNQGDPDVFISKVRPPMIKVTRRIGSQIVLLTANGLAPPLAKIHALSTAEMCTQTTSFTSACAAARPMTATALSQSNQV